MSELNDRRRFLKRALGVSGLLAIWGGISAILFDVWLAAGRFSSAHWSGLTDAADLGGEGVFPFPEQGLALLVSNRSVAAISLECTHLGCLLNVVDNGFFCPCHGSEFGSTGEVYSGPATRSLPWHAVRLRRGKAWVQTEALQEKPTWLPLTADPGEMV